MAEKGKVNPRVDLSQEGQLYRGRDTRVEWICTLPRGREPREVKVVGEVEVSTRDAMGVVGATLTAKLKALHQRRC